jgi:hypothetical protein
MDLAMPPRDPEQDRRIAAVVRRERLKVGLVVLLVSVLGVWWFLSSFYENHCACLRQECFDIIFNVKTHGSWWK